VSTGMFRYRKGVKGDPEEIVPTLSYKKTARRIYGTKKVVELMNVSDSKESFC
jgi:hypothetical protein